MSGSTRFLAGVALGVVAVLLLVALQLRHYGVIKALLTGKIFTPPAQSPVRVVGGSITFRAANWTAGASGTYYTNSDTSEIHVEYPALSGQQDFTGLTSWEMDVYGHDELETGGVNSKGNGIKVIGVNGLITLTPMTQDSKFYNHPAIPMLTTGGTTVTGKRYHDRGCDPLIGDPGEKLCNHIGRVDIIINQQKYPYSCPGGECSFGIGKQY